FQPKERYFKGRVVETIGRLSKFFPDTDGRGLAKTLRFIEKEFERVAERFNSELSLENYSNLERITRDILPKDDSALQFTETKEGLDIELDIAFEDLFNRLVNIHLQKKNKEEVTTDG